MLGARALAVLRIQPGLDPRRRAPKDERPERAVNECAARNGGDCKIVTSFCSGATG